jgi:hypothetical protein
MNLTSCPISTKILTPGVMNRCRIEKPFLEQVVDNKILTPETGCPFLKSCGLVSLISQGGQNRSDGLSKPNGTKGF